MPQYSFIKISNNRDPADFLFECTSMKHPRARISCIRTQLFRWEDDIMAGVEGKWRPVWDFLLKDYSFYVVEKKHFDSLADARAYREVVHDRYRHKYNLSQKDIKDIY